MIPTPESATAASPIVYAAVLERATDTRGWYRLQWQNKTSWVAVRLATLRVFLRGGCWDAESSRMIVVARDNQRTRFYQIAPTTGQLTLLWEPPANVPTFTGLADTAVAGTFYASTQTGLYLIVLPVTRATDQEYHGTEGRTDLLLEATLPSFGETAGTGRAQIAIASNDDKWRRSQGPVPVEMREVTRAPGGDWTPSPIAFQGVLADSAYQAGVYRANVIPVTEAALHRSRVPEWSSLEQLRQTDGADTALSRLRSVGVPMPFPNRVGG